MADQVNVDILIIFDLSTPRKRGSTKKREKKVSNIKLAWYV
jgi:hypothetical protein